MPTTLYALSATDLRMRWKETYVTDGLNRKSKAGPTPGVYRGFVLGGSGTNNQLVLSAGGNDSVHRAVVQTAGGHQIMVELTGTISFSLSTFAVGKEIGIYLYASYSVGATTAAEIRGYNITDGETPPANYDAIGLGTVVMPNPAAPLVVGTDIFNTRRRQSWLGDLSRLDDQVPMTSIVRDGYFQGLDASPALRAEFGEWYKDPDGSVGIVDRATDAPSFAQAGVHNTFSLEFQSTAPATNMTASVVEPCWVPVDSETRYHVRAWIKIVNAPTTGAPALKLKVVNPSTNATLGTLSVNLTHATVGSWVLVEKAGVLGSVIGASVPGRIDSVELAMNSAQWAVGAPTAVLRIGAVDVRITPYEGVGARDEDDVRIVRVASLLFQQDKISGGGGSRNFSATAAAISFAYDSKLPSFLATRKNTSAVVKFIWPGTALFLSDGGDGEISVEGTSSPQLLLKSGPNISGGNQLVPRNTPKAWGVLICDGANNVTLGAEYGVFSVANGAGAAVEVTLDTPFATDATTYAPLVTIESTTPHYATVVRSTTSVFLIYVWSSAGVAVDPFSGGAAMKIHFHVHGYV